jgi:hypothetical protein
MAKETDQKTLDLIKEVKIRKAEIAKLDKPNWQTNCAFSYTDGDLSKSINIQVESNIKTLIDIASFVLSKESDYIKTVDLLKVESIPHFTWQGFTALSWFEDIKTRINKLQIVSKKKKLELLENRLNAIISPELKAQMELDAIAEELK